MIPESKLCLSVAEVARQLGISRPKAYELVRREDFPKIYIDRRVIVPISGLQTWLEEQSGYKA